MSYRRRTPHLVVSVALAILLCLTHAAVVRAEGAASEGWNVELSLFFLAPTQSGSTTMRGITAPVDIEFSDIWDNLDMAGMGSVRVSHGRWAARAEAVYMDLGRDVGPLSVDFSQLVVDLSVGYAVRKELELLVGVRYNNLSGGINGPFGRNPSGTQEWWDPFVGGLVTLPISDSFSFNLRADIGGFGVGSDLTWQLFPYLNWQISRGLSLQAGYRWLDIDYQSGSGSSAFAWDVLTEGVQIGLTYRF